LIGPKTKYGRAYGLGQFMKNTAPWIADMSDVEYDDDLLFDPYYSIHLTYVYLDFLHEQYDNWHQALTAYHRGINGLDKYMEKNGQAKSEYATEILQGVKEDEKNFFVYSYHYVRPLNQIYTNILLTYLINEKGGYVIWVTIQIIIVTMKMLTLH